VLLTQPRIPRWNDDDDDSDEADDKYDEDGRMVMANSVNICDVIENVDEDNKVGILCCSISKRTSPKRLRRSSANASAMARAAHARNVDAQFRLS
jgi:hypothetical protein